MTINFWLLLGESRSTLHSGWVQPGKSPEIKMLIIVSFLVLMLFRATGRQFWVEVTRRRRRRGRRRMVFGGGGEMRNKKINVRGRKWQATVFRRLVFSPSVCRLGCSKGRSLLMNGTLKAPAKYKSSHTCLCAVTHINTPVHTTATRAHTRYSCDGQI